jgi:hypothetical protein
MRVPSSTPGGMFDVERLLLLGRPFAGQRRTGSE